MNAFFLLVILLMLNIGAGAFASELPSSICSEQIEATIAQDTNHSAHSHYASLKVSDQHQSQCADPCHFGQSHIGHCSFMASSSDIRLAEAPFGNLHAFPRLVRIEEPYLDGLRRPPRA